MRKILLVGGGGYIGTRVLRGLRDVGIDASVIDLGIYSNVLRPSDIADYDPEDYKDAVVCWLASFHREPDGVSFNPEWVEAYETLMDELPNLWAQKVFHLVYLSSMRANTDDSLYGRTKLYAEQRLLREAPHASVHRFGTVWGDFSETQPNRPNTAVNYALTRNTFYGDHWEAFTTHISDVVDHLVNLLSTLADPEAVPHAQNMFCRQAENVTDSTIPLKAGDIRSLLDGKAGEFMQAPFDSEQGAARAFTRGVGWKDVDILAAAHLCAYYKLRAPRKESK